MGKASWIVALLLGFLAWAFLAADFQLPLGALTDLSGAPLVISPAEIPMVLAPALAGPPGIVTSVLALALVLMKGAFGRMLATSLTHVVGGVWLVFAYRFSFQRTKMPLRLAAWAGIIVVYFMLMLFLFPVFNPGQYHFSPAAILGFIQVAWLPSLYELIGTLIITSIILFALPEKYRRPLWYRKTSL